MFEKLGNPFGVLCKLSLAHFQNTRSVLNTECLKTLHRTCCLGLLYKLFLHCSQIAKTPNTTATGNESDYPSIVLPTAMSFTVMSSETVTWRHTYVCMHVCCTYYSPCVTGVTSNESQVRGSEADYDIQTARLKKQVFNLDLNELRVQLSLMRSSQTNFRGLTLECSATGIDPSGSSPVPFITTIVFSFVATGALGLVFIRVFVVRHNQRVSQVFFLPGNCAAPPNTPVGGGIGLSTPPPCRPPSLEERAYIKRLHCKCL